MKNHAFLILAHNQPELLSRIVSVLKAPNHYFFIHVDAKCEDFQRFRDAINRIGGGGGGGKSILYFLFLLLCTGGGEVGFWEGSVF